MFCDNCGEKIEEGSKFCDNCGSPITERAIESKKKLFNPEIFFAQLKQKLNLKNFLNRRTLILSATAITVLLLLLIGISEVYRIYEKTEIALENSTQELQSTKEQLSTLQASTTAELSAQQNLINKTSGDLQLSESKLNNMKSQLQNLQNSNSNQSSISSSRILSSIAPAVVKLVCSADAGANDWQQGSGLLFIGNDGGYSIQTNLHVAQTSDGSPSECFIALYPNDLGSNSVLLYQSSGYYFSVNPNADIAYITPELINYNNAGTIGELAKYALSGSQKNFCSNSSIGDHLWVLGYPAIGGNTLTVTNGTISGFEADSGINYIKTDAKIDHGNSGGIAIEDSGCILGIPTWAENLGGFESLGRILDLSSIK